jgi:hypothetical protein
MAKGYRVGVNDNTKLAMKVNFVVVISRYSVRIFATSLRLCPQPADMQMSGEGCPCVFASLQYLWRS